MEAKSSKDLVAETLKNLEGRVNRRKKELKDSQILPEKPKCLKCLDSLFIPIQKEGDIFPSMMPCDCRIWKRKQMLVERWVPEMWRGLRVKDLQSAEEIGIEFPVKHQDKVIKELKEDPLGSHSFFGPSGVGKSRFLYCLLQESIEASCKHIFFSKMASLLRSMKDNEFKQLPEERWGEIITTHDIAECTGEEPYHIFIDEIDKIPITDDIYLRVFELLDYIYENQEKAKLCVCSNLAVEKFINIWGEGIWRRISVVSNTHVLWRE